jgi:hypothetical protein
MIAPSAQAQTWEPIEDDAELTELFSDTVIEATLRGGVKAVARYNRDGTGVLEAWGDKFERTWEVRDGQVCIGLGQQVTCYTLERDADNPGDFRARNVTTGELLEVTIREGKATERVTTPTTEAGAAGKPSAEEIAAKLANPNAPLATLNLKLQYRTYEGDLPGADDQDGTTLLFQPSFPFALSNGDVVFFRPALPFQLSTPFFDPNALEFDDESGLGDITFDLAYGRTTKRGILWATGIVSTLPTATEDALGSDRYTLGPELLIGKLSKKYVIGAFPNHQWDVGGSGDAAISLTTAQLFLTILPGGGWNLGSAPITSFNHKTDEWTIPLNFTLGKTVIWNGRPWKLSVELNYFVEQPDAFGPEWLVGVNIGPVVKNVLANLFQRGNRTGG